jgi:hypothetical protein
MTTEAEEIPPVTMLLARRDLQITFNVGNVPEMSDTLVHRLFQPKRVIVQYVWDSIDQKWRISSISIAGTAGSAEYGHGTMRRVAQAPDWALTEARKHLPKD